MDLKRPYKLTLFFTRGVSLRTWDTVGMFEREVALYRRLQSRGLQIAFITYGDATELDYQSRLPGIRILCNRWNLPPAWYEYLLPWLHGAWLRRSDVLKTNQTNGADVALRAARLWRKPLIARSGYLWSANTARQFGADSPEASRALEVETKVLRVADRVVVTTSAIAETVCARIPAAASRVKVIPNYVDTELFAPNPGKNREFDLVFVGRLSPEKNIPMLFEAIEELPVRLLIIGDGEKREEVQKYAMRRSGQVEWHSRIPNERLTAQINRARIFTLLSQYEGHPKVLLEAMACGLPVIGANSPGIRELIQHGETGWLCEPDPAGIRAAIEHLLSNEKLQLELGNHAREYALKNFALNCIVDLELGLLVEVLNEV